MNISTTIDDNVVDLRQLLANLLRYRVAVIGITVFCFAMGILLAFVITPVYRAEVTMIPVQSSQPSAGSLSIASQLQNLSGIIGLGSSSDETEEALATLQARNLTTDFIEKYDLLPQLFKSAWDPVANDWAVPEPDRPTLWDAYKKFDQTIRKVSQDTSTGIVTLTVDWYDPQVAATWANNLVAEVNSRMRARAVDEARRNLEYLRQQLDTSSLVELRQGLASLIEAQINKIMLANSRDDYSFRVIDPAIPPDQDAFVKPNRLLLIVGGLFGGLLLGSVFALGLSALRGEQD